MKCYRCLKGMNLESFKVARDTSALQGHRIYAKKCENIHGIPLKDSCHAYSLPGGIPSLTQQDNMLQSKDTA